MLGLCFSVHASDQRLILQLSSGIHAERANAAYLLGMSEDPGAASLLLNQLKEEPVKKNRLVIIESVRKLNTKDGYSGLSSYYPDEKDIEVRRKILKVLGDSRDPRFIELIAKNLYNPDKEDQRLALSSLSQIDNREAAQAIVRYFLTQPSQQQKEWALSAIAVQKRKEAVKPLVQCGIRTHDKSERVRISETLAELRDSEAQDAIFVWFQEEQDSHSKKRLIRSLKNVGSSKIVGALSNELKNNDLNLQVEIVGAMVFIDEQASAPYLHSYYEETMEALDPNMSRLEAVTAIRLHKLLRQVLSIEESADNYPEQWKKDPVISRMIAG